MKLHIIGVELMALAILAMFAGFLCSPADEPPPDPTIGQIVAPAI